MPNQEKKTSLLQPVGKAVMLGLPILETGKTIAIFEASQVPVDAELYVHPKDSRLMLEVEVANDNASHWHGHLVAAQAKNSELRKRIYQLEGRADRLSSELQKAKLMLLNIHDSQYPSATSTDIYQFLFGRRK